MANYRKTNITVTVNSVDVTEYVILSTLRITSAITYQVDTAKFTIDASAGIGNWEEIVITDGGVKIFAGYIQILTGSQVGVHTNKTVHYDVSCSDYSVLLDKRLVRAEYIDKTDAYIIDDLFTTYLSDINADTYISQIRTIDKVRFNRVTLRKALDQITRYSGADWYVDYDKKLHFFVAEENDASFGLSDAPDNVTTFGYQNIKDTRDATGVVNRVEVVGGNYLSEDETFYVAGNGKDVNITIPQKLSAPDGESSILAYRNEGGASTNLIINPRFEVNVTDGWTHVTAGGGSIARSTVEKYTGSASCLITGGTEENYLYSPNISLANGESLSARTMVLSYAELLSPGGGGYAVPIASIRIRDVTNGSVVVERANSSAGEFQLLAITWENDTGSTVNARLELSLGVYPDTNYAYFDAVQIEKQTWPSGYIDGTLGTGYAWTGTADNSTSTRDAAAGDIFTLLYIAILNIDELTEINQVLYSFEEQLLKGSVFWPDLSNALKVTGRYEVPLFTRVRDTYSKEVYGLWLDGVIADSNINSKPLAKLEAKNLLAKSALEKTVYTLDCWEPGLKAGQSVNLVNSLLSVNAKFLIQKVTMTVTDNGSAISMVEMGVYNPDLVAIIIQLSRDAQEELPWRDDEVLDEVLEETERIAVSESATVTATNEYNWGPDANPLIWNFGRWGSTPAVSDTRVTSDGDTRITSDGDIRVTG